ncbi:hypothetical protein AcW1_005861 [Taiwanofungus camphoratus]|nr:hypothetical protein AcW2_004616 [Antrodia cinnamomea]KAI0934281.1 hypothetical protein AcV5_006177 [Antrodia cinnamomea]KAI0957479.1 hypothetical protein AcW1_005861 [Antrodia cinnamomea]
MSQSSTEAQIELHIWPPQSPVLSFDTSCVAALLYVQIAIPGRFSVVYCANPDLSPSGQLPYLTHGLHSMSTLPSIIKYMANLKDARDLDESLSPAEKAQCAARISHVYSDYGDFVAHMLYALNTNWWRVTRPALVSMLPVPQRYYVPGRLRESFRPRLESAELWNIPGTEQDQDEDRISSFHRPKPKRKKQDTDKQKIKRTFEREKVLEKARAFFSIYSKLLGERPFFHPRLDRPTSLDVIFAAHTHLLMNLSFPDLLLQSLLSESYPNLVSHATGVQSFAFPDPQSFPQTVQSSLALSLRSLVPLPRFAWTTHHKHLTPPDSEERRFTMMRWGWIGLGVAAAVTYVSLFGLGIRLVIVGDELPEEDAVALDEDEDILLEDEEVEEVGE